jgi:hypothetical protein
MAVRYNNCGLVRATKYLAVFGVAAVEPLGIQTVDVLHVAGKKVFRCPLLKAKSRFDNHLKGTSTSMSVE